jgi:dimethylargininase
MPHIATNFDHAIVRLPSASVTAGLRATKGCDPSFEGVLAEHRAYVAALQEAGVTVEILAALPDFPDSMFVEDPALVFGNGAILLRPGAASRAGEAALLAPVLQRRFACLLAVERGRVDGGDVLALPDRVLIGLSSRTDRIGAEALLVCLKALGRDGEIVETPDNVLHFKSDCALLDEQTVLVTTRLAASGVFEGLRTILVPAGEESAANALRVNDIVLVSAGFPATLALLRRLGTKVKTLATAEIAKIDAGLSCMSLRWQS